MIWRPVHPDGLVWRCLYVDQQGIQRVAGTVWRMGPLRCPTWLSRTAHGCSGHPSMRHAAELVEDRCADIVFGSATVWDGGPR